MFSVSELFWPFLLQSNQLVFLLPRVKLTPRFRWRRAHLDGVAAAETVTFAVAVRADASLIVAVMVWVPGVINVTPLINVWDPASFEVNP